MSDLATFPNMKRAIPAIVMIGLLSKCRNGRRRSNLEAQARWGVLVPEVGNSARHTVMLPRSERRARVKDLRSGMKRTEPERNRIDLRASVPFRPVYGHGLRARISQADAISYLRTKNHDVAAKWAEQKESQEN